MVGAAHDRREGRAAAVNCRLSHLRTGPCGVHLELALPQDWSVRDGLEVHLDCTAAIRAKTVRRENNDPRGRDSSERVRRKVLQRNETRPARGIKSLDLKMFTESCDRQHSLSGVLYKAKKRCVVYCCTVVLIRKSVFKVLLDKRLVGEAHCSEKNGPFSGVTGGGIRPLPLGSAEASMIPVEMFSPAACCRRRRRCPCACGYVWLRRRPSSALVGRIGQESAAHL